MPASVGPYGVSIIGVIRVHGSSACSGQYCCLHNPSPHPLDHATLNWRQDRGFTERICPHGIGHPDPDSLAYLARRDGEFHEPLVYLVHGCDGCCGGYGRRGSAGQPAKLV